MPILCYHEKFGSLFFLQTGYLVPPGDTQGFTDRVKTLLDDKALRNKMSIAGREETERWSWEAATSILRNVQYQKVVNWLFCFTLLIVFLVLWSN